MIIKKKGMTESEDNFLSLVRKAWRVVGNGGKVFLVTEVECSLEDLLGIYYTTMIGYFKCGRMEHRCLDTDVDDKKFTEECFEHTVIEIPI